MGKSNIPYVVNPDGSGRVVHLEPGPGKLAWSPVASPFAEAMGDSEAMGDEGGE